MADRLCKYLVLQDECCNLPLRDVGDGAWECEDGHRTFESTRAVRDILDEARASEEHGPRIKELVDSIGANLPHSRACGPFCRGHGPACSTNCPTCHGLPFLAADETFIPMWLDPETPSVEDAAKGADPHNVAIQAVLDAWTISGPHVAYHTAWQQRLRKEWPVLYSALQDLVKAFERKDKI